MNSVRSHTLSSDPYEPIARYYDAENAEKVTDLPTYTLLAERFGGPVLEVGCGTGRVALHLAAQGYDVTGVEPSEPMLAKAREEAEERGLAERVTWEQAAADDFAAADGHGLAIMAYATFGHLLEQADQIAALRHIARHLRPGGGIAIDIPNAIHAFRTDDAAGLSIERIFDDPETGESVIQQSYSELDRVEQTVEITWVYDRVAEDGVVRRTVAPMAMRFTFAPEMALLLERCGFEAMETYGNFSF
nr:class I SAM-dependent methyltransferase [Gammaproteobacteria bacterium]